MEGAVVAHYEDERGRHHYRRVERVEARGQVQREAGGSGWVVAPLLALDLDHTVRFDSADPEGFVNDPETVQLYPGTEEMLWEYREAGFLIAGVSNQGGVAYSIKTPQDIDDLRDAMLTRFDRDPFHFIKECLHHPKGNTNPYCYRSLLRKPDYGMLALIEAEAFEHGYVIDWEKSIVVGDREEDAQMARNAGVRFEWTDMFFERF